MENGVFSDWTALDFVVHDVSAIDGGSYTCIAENQGNRVNASAVQVAVIV